MNANQMKHAANLAEWRQRIIECRASGQPVKTWCKNNRCNPSTYYRWEREIVGRIKKTTAEDSDTLVGSEALLPAPKQDLVEVQLAVASSNTPVSVVQSPFRPVAVIRIGTMEISLTNSVSGKLIKQIKELLPDAE